MLRGATGIGPLAKRYVARPRQLSVARLTHGQPGLSYEIGADTDVRQRFIHEGRLGGGIDKNFRAINNRW